MQTRYLAGTVKVFGILIILFGFMYPASAVQASWLDRVKDIYQLPENVQQIQKDYETTKQQLEDQKDKLSEAIRHSQETEERLLGQNETLKRENEQLQERLKAMEQVALDKDKRNRKLTYMVVTAVLLIVLYFVLGRVFRFMVWRRQKRGMR
ncbi:hypothetical protein M5X11_20250 [Paenibacillus alginolyticus]|uniref:SH3 domain protein n=1 Tax=Paenibacillus alginolyticus TaxID=59839 RepID=A0ABT4G8P8_9BACL|nr:hypothetical protein [Paenibacillus alginolyticus]MCY9667234.1 hypothetical protein [Paenibacillus alginolyticus]MCY9692515.1 hypothetical protein [Paenibacillus alginolyticus]MEC0144308.1 hypothetical protein [Paenibacillus alginolyticus]